MILSKDLILTLPIIDVQKGPDGINVAIPFEGDKKTVGNLLKCFKLKSKPKRAKAIFENKEDQKIIIFIKKTLK